MLPETYETEFASEALNDIIRDFDTDENEGGNPCLTSAKIDQYKVFEYSEPQSWRLSSVDRGTGDHEPALFRVHGIIQNLELPPISKPTSSQAMERMRPHIRQAISLTGIKSDLFLQNVSQLEKIHVMFLGTLPSGTIRAWRPVYQGTNLVLDMHNRYFTKQTLVPNSQRMAFNHRVDPDGYLNDMQKDQKFVHVEDNIVEYFGVGHDASGSVSAASPIDFRIGDIVEATIEFAAFPSAPGKQSAVILILRGVRMVSPDFRNRAAMFDMRARYIEPPVAPRVGKRRMLYGDGEVNIAAERIKRLQLTVDDEESNGDADQQAETSKWQMRG